MITPPRSLLAVLMAAALVAGILFVLMVPAGLPYDEPSHWSVVQYIAHHGRPPVLVAAILIKVSTLPVLIGVCLWLLFRRQWGKSVCTAIAAIVVSGWWFERNLHHYGDLTGQSAVARTGVTFPHVELGAGFLVKSVLTYLILPTEYVRNIIAAPAAIDLCTLIFAAGIAMGSALLVLRGRHELDTPIFILLVLVGVISVVAWLAQVLIVQPVAFRTAYGVLPLVALCLGFLTTFRSPIMRRTATATVLLCEIVIIVWFLAVIGGQPAMLNP